MLLPWLTRPPYGLAYVHRRKYIKTQQERMAQEAAEQARIDAINASLAALQEAEASASGVQGGKKGATKGLEGSSSVHVVMGVPQPPVVSAMYGMNGMNACVFTTRHVCICVGVLSMSSYVCGYECRLRRHVNPRPDRMPAFLISCLWLFMPSSPHDHDHLRCAAPRAAWSSS